MNPPILIDDATADKVAVELSREIANAIEESIALSEQGRIGEAQAVINKLCRDIRYKPMVGVVPNGNVKLTEHPVIQHCAQELANASRFGEANFSIPLNGRGPWTPALKGKLDINDMIREVHGLRIIIENAKGSLRCGYTKDGKRWEVRMPADYGCATAVDTGGFVPIKPGADGDGVDCWLGGVPSEQVHIIDQRDLDTKKFDEHKCFVDFASRQTALATYLNAYSDGKAHQRIMGIRTMTIPQFKAWLQTANTKKRASRKNLVIANAIDDLQAAKAHHDKVRDEVEDIYREELNDAVVAGSVSLSQFLINEYESGKDTDGLIVLFNDALRMAGERAFKASAPALGWPLQGRELDRQAKSYAENRLPDLQNAVSKVRSTVSASIQRGVAAGESKEALARRIREGFRLAKPELDLIAETETQIVYGVVQHEALRMAGFDWKRWITQNDERVRHSHTLCEAQGAIEVGKSFHNGLKFPGDPNGDISEIIHCRCYLLGES